MRTASLPEINLLLGESLSSQKWESLFLNLFRGRLEADEIRKLLLLMATKGEKASEIIGCVRALRQVESCRPTSLPFLIDVCGTGGDGRKTFNISTVSAFVIAAAGGYVAKHGNRAISSESGSSDLMEALGIRLDLSFPQMLTALRKFHLGYFHAPLYHPSFMCVQAVRRNLGIRTLFNLLGPLVNPVELPYQMMGVSNPHWLSLLAEVLKTLGRKRAAVFRSRDGLDELSTRESSDILYLEKGRVQKIFLDPKKLEFSKVKGNDFEGGDAKTNREIALQILENRVRGPRQEIVLLNSGFALWLTGIAASLKEGIARSQWAIRTGRAQNVLKALRQFTTAAGSGN